MKISPAALYSFVAWTGVLLATRAPAAEAAFEDGKFPPPKPAESKWVDLLGDRLESHWSDMNCTLSGSFKLTRDSEGVAVLAGSGRPIGLVRSLQPYENFILELEWRHLTEAPSAKGGDGTTGNSGLYVWADPIPPPGNCFTRAIEVQVCNLGNGAWYTSHGDLFPIHGATMTPDRRFGISGSRSMPVEFRGRKTGQWNQCRITCVDGTIQQEINGAVVTAGFRSSPRKGYLCLESEGGPVEFKHMRITELPVDPALKPDQVSLILPAGQRTICLFNGLDLEHWTGAGPNGVWAVEDRFLRSTGKPGDDLTRNLGEGDFDLIVDWSFEKPGDQAEMPISVDGLGLPAKIPAAAVHREGWNRLELRLQAGSVSAKINNQVAIANQTLPSTTDGRRVLRLRNTGQAIKFCNLMRLDAVAAGR